MSTLFKSAGSLIDLRLNRDSKYRLGGLTIPFRLSAKGVCARGFFLTIGFSSIFLTVFVLSASAFAADVAPNSTATQTVNPAAAAPNASASAQNAPQTPSQNAPQTPSQNAPQSPSQNAPQTPAQNAPAPVPPLSQPSALPQSPQSPSTPAAAAATPGKNPEPPKVEKAALIPPAPAVPQGLATPPTPQKALAPTPSPALVAPVAPSASAQAPSPNPAPGTPTPIQALPADAQANKQSLEQKSQGFDASANGAAKPAAAPAAAAAAATSANATATPGPQAPPPGKVPGALPVSRQTSYLSYVASENDAPEISFGDAYEIIIDRSLRVETQAAQISIAEARRLKAYGAFAPGLIASTGSYSTQTVAPDPGTFGVRQGLLTMTYNILHGGSDYQTVRAARGQVHSERAKLETERQLAETDGGTALVNAIAKGLIRDVAAQIAASKAEINQVAQQRYEKGLLPLQEVEKSKVELENFRASLNDAETDLANARADLRALLGLARVRAEWPWKAQIAKDAEPGQSLLEAPFDLRTRPDWRAADYQVEADRRRARAAWLQLLPSLDFTASYGSYDMSDPGRRDWAVMTVFSVNLFDRAVTLANAQEREGFYLISQYAREAIERRAESDVDIRRQAHRIAVRTALAREKSLEASRSLLDDSEKRFRAGRATVNDLAIDQGRYSDSERLSIDGWSQAHLSLLRLCHELGGHVEATGSCKRPEGVVDPVRQD